MESKIQNNFNKLVILNELDKSNILATLINKGSNILPTSDSKYSIGNDYYRWDKIHTNQIYNKDSIKIISNSIKSNYETRIILATNGMSTDSLNFQSPYGGIFFKSGRPLTINSDLNTESDIINMKSSISIQLNTPKAKINLNNNGEININSNNIINNISGKYDLKCSKIYLGNDSDSEIIVRGKINISNLDNYSLNSNISTEIFVGIGFKYENIQSAIMHIKKLRDVNKELKNVQYKINVVNNKLYNESIDIITDNIILSGYNNIKFSLNGNINIKMDIINNIILENIDFENIDFENFKNFIYIQGSDGNIVLKNIYFNLKDLSAIYCQIDYGNLIIQNCKIYTDNVNTDYLIKITEIKNFKLKENEFYAPLSSETNHINILDNDAVIFIENNKFYNGKLSISPKCIFMNNIIFNKNDFINIDKIYEKNNIIIKDEQFL